MLTPEQFYKKMVPYARQACRALGAPVDPAAAVILAQWDVESGREMATWVGYNNYAGITWGSPDKGFRRYEDPADFVADYVEVLLTTWGGRAYADLVATLRSSATALEMVEQLASSPWDAGHYGQAEGLPRGELLRQRLHPYQLMLATDLAAEQPTALDVAEWAQEAREQLMARGITDGTRPKDQLTREEGWALIYRMRQQLLEELLAAVGGGQGER